MGVGTGDADVTLTVVLFVTDPPEPVQTSSNVVAEVSGPTDSVPDVLFAPLQPPEAEQEAAFVEDHVSCVWSPEAIEALFGLKVSVGAGVGVGVEPAI